MLAIHSTDFAVTPHQHTADTRWLQYFDLKQAIASIGAHLQSLPSAGTPEKHTRSIYLAGLKYYLNWAGPRLDPASDEYRDASIPDLMIWSYTTLHMPTEDVMQAFIAHLRSKGLKPSSIASKYLAPVRHFCRKLARQHIAVSGLEREFVQDCKERIQAAAEVKAPAADESSLLSPLYAHGNRLSRAAVETVFQSIERESKLGQRDLALLYLGFTSGLRLAELQRLTLASFAPWEDHYVVNVRGKRNNMTPVPVDYTALQLVRRYVDAYNADLPADDARRITDHSPLWQPLLHGDNYAIVGTNGYRPDRGISTQGLRAIIERRVQAATGHRISPHDMRRTIAALMRKDDTPIESIQMLLRHKNAATTARYIGNPPQLSSSIYTRGNPFNVL